MEPTASVRSGSGEPLLLIHPFTTSHDVWADVLPTLAKEYDVVAVTLPGHWGGPPLRRRDVSLAAYADGVEAAMDDLGWETAHLVGNSIGGWLSFELARRGRARSVTAIAPAGGWTKWSPNALLVGAKFVALYPLVAVGHLLGERVTRLGRFATPFLALVSANPRRVPRARADNLLRASSRCPSFFPFLVKELRHTTVLDLDGLDERVPLRLVLCEHDRIVPAKRYGPPYVAMLPSMGVVTLPDVGHIPMFEAPDLVADTILEHVRAHRSTERDASTA